MMTRGDSLEKTIVLEGKTYHLTFEDDFTGNDIDPSKWARCPEIKRQDIGGYWQDSMTEVHDGNLWLWAKIDDDGVPRSGAVRSKGIFEQAYGYFEAKMMFPRTTGFWGAFWMMCGDVGKVDGSGVSGAEIDIIETGRCVTKGVNHAVHWDGYGDEHQAVSSGFVDPALYSGWHNYGLLWKHDEYVFFVDGIEKWRTTGGGVCEKPGYLKLTTEFGTWAEPLVPEELPDCLRVAWVRVYAE